MEKIAAIVEGHLEAHFMNSVYPRVLVQRCIPNSDDLRLELIIEAISDQLDVLDGSITRIVVLLDREGRAASSAAMVNELKSALAEKSPHRHFYIGVADREAENWILSDEPMIRQEFGLLTYSYDGDGGYGKNALRAITGYDYAPRDKARLLKKVSVSEGARTSAI